MIYYKIIYFFITKKPEHFHYFDIGIFDTNWQALNLVKELKTKEGFCLRPDKIYIIRVVRFCKPKFLNRIHWAEGFFSYPYSKQSNNTKRKSYHDPKEFIYAMQKGLGSRRMLTDDLLQECLYDSNSEIRKYGGS